MFDMTDHAMPILSFPASSFKMTLMPCWMEIKPIYMQEHEATQSRIKYTPTGTEIDPTVNPEYFVSQNFYTLVGQSISSACYNCMEDKDTNVKW